jgi:hypothetical protein
VAAGNGKNGRKGKKAGRKSLFTEALRNKVLKAIEKGLTRRMAFAIAGVSGRTYERYANMAAEEERPEQDAFRRFWRKIEEREAIYVERLLGIIEDGMPKDPKLALQMLERRFTDDFGRIITEQRIKKTETHEITVKVLADAKSRKLAYELTDRLGLGAADSGGNGHMGN